MGWIDEQKGRADQQDKVMQEPLGLKSKVLKATWEIA